MRHRPGLLGLLSGSIVGVLLTMIVVMVDGSAGRPDQDPVTEFLDAWSRHRQGTWAVDGHFERFLDSDEPVLSVDTFSVQRPPDHLSLRAGVVNGLVAGSRVVCVADPAGGSRCTANPSATSYYDQVRNEVDEWRSILLGPAAVFAITSQGNCFSLTRLRDDAVFDRYGQASTLCFDPTTGALDASEIRHAQARDVYRANDIRSAVNDADFELPT